MRPCDTALRQRYQAAAEELRALGKPVTPRTLSLHLAKNYHAVRTFFNRNRNLAQSMGVKIGTHHTKEQYSAVREELLEQGGFTLRSCGSRMGKHHTSVLRALQEKPPRLRTVERPLPAVEAADETPAYVPSWVTTVRMTREITVQHLDLRSMRIVLNKVSPARYIQLWDAKHLDFQIKGLPKPRHLPTREEIEKFLL